MTGPAQPAPDALDAAAAAIEAWRAVTRSAVLVIALDGHGAAGKSTLTAQLQQRLDLAVLHTDDFFLPIAAQAAAADDAQPMSRYYDWQRLRSEALTPLRRAAPASFAAFDEERGRFLDALRSVDPRPVILIEGVSSAAPALGDLVDHAILVSTPAAERLARLRQRISPEAWDERWLRTESEYFSSLPGDHFDLTISGASD